VDSIRPLRPHVLVVDNRHDAAVSLARLLERWGFQPVVAYDGPSAVAVALAQPPAAVLLGLGLPGLDGCEVARRLRGLPRMGEALLVALTGYGEEEDVRRCHEVGIDLHLLKPYESEELHRVLDERLAAQPTP
jgi:CheY-like chemotaxis protein